VTVTSGPVTGVVGLGNMGSELAANLVTAGHQVVTHDIAGPERSPEGATFVVTVDEVARRTDVIVCSLPDGAASEAVARAVATARDRRAGHVVDTSTIGVAAARVNDEILSAAGLGYVDAPVSGGVAGARARTLSVMYAAPEAACDAVAAVLAGLSDRRHRVGERPGMAQALKLANNFLSAVALAATSEAVAFGVSAGLDMATMIDVLNVSSGQSQATSDKFPAHVVTARYQAGFTNSLMCKDLGLYLGAVEEQGRPATLGHVTSSVWEEFEATEPGADFTRIYPFVEGS
jgi:3-hydroxyisobutyrate dehydrogenase-like beta-hydroxyacid dehydrogenase